MKTYIRIFPILFLLLIASCVTTPKNDTAMTFGDLPWEISPFAASYEDMSKAVNNFAMEDEHGVRILLSEGHFTFNKDGSLVSKYKWVYKILDQSGIDNWSSTQVSWTPWNQARPVIKVRVTNPDGNSYFLTRDHIIESTESSDMANIYSDRKMLQAPFPRVTVGSIVEEETTMINAVPKFGTGISRSWYFEGSNPIAMNRVLIDVPENLAFNYKVSLKEDFKPEITNNDGIKTFTFEYPLVPIAKEIESGLSPDHPRWVSLAFSTGESWEKIAKVYSDLIEEKLGSAGFSEELEILVKDTAHATAVSITQWLNREIRYTGLELGTGSIIPSTPEITLERGFGDCKDKAVIVTAMMREAGFDAWVALLRAGSSRDVDPSLPGLGGFNHAIVYIGGENPFWIDPTSEFSFDGYLPLSDQNRWALIASPLATNLVKTSVSIASDNKTVRNIEYFLNDTGFSDVLETTTYFGADDGIYRSRYLFMKEDDINTGIEDYIQRSYRFGENTGFEYSDTEDFVENFNVSLSIEGAGRGVTEDSQAIVAIMQGELVNHLPGIFLIDNEDEDENEDKRKDDYYFYKPFTFETNYTINPPEGFSLRELPKSEIINLGEVTIEKQYKLTGKVVEAVLILRSGKRSLSAEDFEKTREEVISFSKEKPILIVFDHIGEKLLAEGDYRGSIDYLKAISIREPEKEIHLIRLAGALLKAGLGRDARLAAKRAVELNGESEKAFSKLAWILQHDELGVRFGPGYDRGGAIAAYEKAVEFDTDEWSNYANLAILLEYDENGLRYSNGNLREAIETYKQIGDKLADKGMEINVITDLLYLQDWQELENALEKLENRKTVTLYKVVVHAAAGDFDAAIGEAAKTGNAVDKRNILSSAGELLIHIRDYASAAVLLGEAAKGSPDAMSLESRAGVLARTVPFEEIEYDSEDPEALVKRFYKALYLSNGSDFRELEDIVSTDLYERAMDRDNNSNFNSEWWSLRNESIRAGLSLEVILDLMLSDIKFQTRKDSDGGYHLKLIQTGLGTNLDSNFYLRKIGSDLKIAGTDSFRAPIGRVVLEYLDSGKTGSASDWLDWFIKDYSSFVREGDEPLYGHPLQGFWKKRGNDKSDIGAMKLAAASILGTDKKLYREAVSILESGLMDQDENYDLNKFYYALYFAYQTGDDFEGQYRSAHWLYDKYPESDFAWSVLLRSMLNLGRFDELETLANSRLEEDDEDDIAIDMLINSYFSRLDFDSVDRVFQELKDKNRLTARLYNAVAWMYLFKPVVDDTAFEYSRKAVNMSNNKNTAILHTLAALYAEFGRCEEARNTLDRVMELSGSIEPSSDDWYVLGRIAEEYGMIESALFYYGQVEKPESIASQYDSSYTLAMRRLKGLVDKEYE